MNCFNILVIIEHTDLRECVVNLLNMKENRVMALTNSVNHAFEILHQQFDFDVIIVDSDMSELNITALNEHLNKMNIKAPLILLTHETVFLKIQNLDKITPFAVIHKVNDLDIFMELIDNLHLRKKKD